jgi:hypothetical protein
MNCGANLHDDAVFCIECGCALEMHEAPTVDIPGQKAPIEMPPIQAGTAEQFTAPEIVEQPIVQESIEISVERETAEQSAFGQQNAADFEIEIPHTKDIPVEEPESADEIADPTINIKAHYYDYANTIVVPDKQSKAMAAEMQENAASEAASAEEKADDIPGQTPVFEAENTNHCRNCGTELLPESEFCIECGAKT